MFPPESWIFHYKPSILGYPYFWKHPYVSGQMKEYFTNLIPWNKVSHFPSSVTFWGEVVWGREVAIIWPNVWKWSGCLFCQQIILGDYYYCNYITTCSQESIDKKSIRPHPPVPSQTTKKIIFISPRYTTTIGVVASSFQRSTTSKDYPPGN